MSSGTSKMITGLFLGILLGVAGAYLYYNPRLDVLSETVSVLTGDYEGSKSILSDLLNEISELTGEYETLNQLFLGLENEKYILENDYQELETAYKELLEDYELLVASLPLTPQQVSGTTIDRDYQWYFEGKQYDMSLSIPESQYNYYQGLTRAYQDDYSIYVTHPYDDEFINTIIRKFNFIALEDHMTEEDKINLVISFVQSLPYTVDSVTTAFDEYPRYPLETLIDNGGDCEDTSILTASLLHSMNYEVILIAPPEHMAVGVNIESNGYSWTYEEAKYYFLETTGEGWKIGELPDDYKSASAYLYPLNPIPLCVHNWTAEWAGINKMDITIHVENLGSAMAEDWARAVLTLPLLWMSRMMNTHD
jgi:hypothetical protein